MGRFEPDDADDALGLTAAGLVVVSAVLTLTAGIVDALVTGDLGTIFGIGFVLGSVAGAALARHEDRVAAVVAPPLVFAGSAFLAGQLIDADGGYGWVMATVIQTGETLTYQAPWLLLGTGLAAGVTVLRHRQTQSHARRRGARRRPARPRDRRLSR